MSQATSTPGLVERSCPVCASADAVELLRKHELCLLRCARCSMIYASPVPASFASGQYYDREAAGYYLSPAKLESDYAEVRFDRELRLFRKHCRAGKVLDVGCSSGAFLYQLRRRFPGCYEVGGTDASGPALDYAQEQGIPVLRGNFLDLSIDGKKFDAVTLWAVLEHVMAPAAFIDQAGTLLNQQGLCFVLVPNFRTLATRILGGRYRYVYPQHLNYFTRVTLKKLVARRFELVEMRSTHFNPIVIWQDWQRAGVEVSNADRARLLQKTTAYKQSLWLRPARTLYRISEGLLGWLGLADNLAVVLRKL